jgi:hypothetical protein
MFRVAVLMETGEEREVAGDEAVNVGDDEDDEEAEEGEETELMAIVFLWFCLVFFPSNIIRTR